MPLQKLVFTPGVNRENTRYSNEGRWYSMDKVRFRSGTPEKIGGWTPYTSNVFLGTARLLHNWVTLAGENLLAVGTHLKMYIERGGLFWDITPIRSTTGALNNPFTTGAAGSSVVTVTIAAHGAITGDFVTFSGAVAVDGISAATLNAGFQVTVLTSNTFTITATPCTAGGVTGGGAAVVAAFQANTGADIAIVGLGYGVGGYGVDGYGSAATSGAGVVTTGLRQWHADNFGQDLVMCIRNAGVYYWSAAIGAPASLAVRATALSVQVGASDAPTIASQVFVTDDEHVVACGANTRGSAVQDPLLVRWCAQGNSVNWTPAVTNTAGDQRLTAGSYIVAAAKMRQENLIWTDTAIVSMQFVEPPVVFSFTPLASNISIVSPKAVAVANNVAYWMGNGKFYKYDGHVQTMVCDVRKYVFSDINYTQIGQTFTGTNPAFNEVTWYYCAAASDTVTNYVTYNYVENLWTFGTLARSAWVESGLKDHPVAAGLDNKLYYHENGFDDGSTAPYSAISAYLESADFDIGDGQNFSFVSKIIPDVDFDGSTAATPSVTLTLKSRSTPGANFTQTNAQTAVQTATSPFLQFTEYCYTRIRGRQMSFRIESNDVGVTWQLGTPRIEIREDGSR